MRLGRIAWVNCFPVYGAIDRGLVPCEAELVSGTAAELNDLLAAGQLDVSVISAVEYARDAARYHLLPDLAIAADGPVHSVALFARRPPAELDGRTVLLTASSRTSVLLLELLCRHRWGVSPRFAVARAEARNTMAAATSCGCPSRCNGTSATSSAAAWRWPPAMFVQRPVSIGPGLTALTRMWSLAT